VPGVRYAWQAVVALPILSWPAIRAFAFERVVPSMDPEARARMLRCATATMLVHAAHPNYPLVWEAAEASRHLQNALAQPGGAPVPMLRAQANLALSCAVGTLPALALSHAKYLLLTLASDSCF
jgi:hypothetical protein